MKATSPYRTGLTKLFAAFVLLLMFSLEGLQAFHRHSCPNDIPQSQETQLSNAEPDCDFCDYFAHHRHDVFESPGFIAVAALTAQSLPLNDHLVVQVRELTLERSSNKGPPSFA